MLTAVISLITLVLTIAWGIVRYYHGKEFEKRKVWNEFKNLQEAYKSALASGQPDIAAAIDNQLREYRKKFRYLN
jgi:hypothetical protein